MSNHRLSADLEELLRRYSDTGFTLRQVMAAFGERGYGLLLVLLALPSAMPLPAPGYSTPFGVALLVVAVQILMGKTVPWLPNWTLDRMISARAGRKMIGFGARFFKRMEKWVRPRYSWSLHKSGHMLTGIIVLIMAALMTLPIPSTNTVPAAVVFLTGIGMIEKDGAVLVAAFLLGCLSVLLYAVALYLIFRFGLQGVEELKEIVRAWLAR